MTDRVKRQAEKVAFVHTEQEAKYTSNTESTFYDVDLTTEEEKPIRMAKNISILQSLHSIQAKRLDDRDKQLLALEKKIKSQEAKWLELEFKVTAQQEMIKTLNGLIGDMTESTLPKKESQIDKLFYPFLHVKEKNDQ